MIELLIKSRTRRELLMFFIDRPEGRFYLRELQRLLREPLGALKRELEALEDVQLLKSEWAGPLKYFSLNTSHHCLPELTSLIRKDQRKKLLEKNLRRALKTLRKQYQPDKVILYGSLASGQVRPDSDLDLVIIKRDVPGRYWDRVKELSPLLVDRDVAIDYTIWTPDEFAHETENVFLKQEVMKKGKVVYERAA